MEDLGKIYDLEAAAAWVRGQAVRTGRPALAAGLLEAPLGALTRGELEEIAAAGLDLGLKLYPFKQKEALPRVSRVMGFLRAQEVGTLLDVGSGRGVFLLPFLREFPQVEVTALELLDKRAAFLQDLSAGGFSQLTAVRGDVCQAPFEGGSFDVVTMLEVLEHIPQVERAVEAGVRLARKYVVVTVPSKPDNNPEHIHLLTKERLTGLFRNAGCTRLHFDGVRGHMFMAAAVPGRPDGDN